jgi:hypothetical protein
LKTNLSTNGDQWKQDHIVIETHVSDSIVCLIPTVVVSVTCTVRITCFVLDTGRFVCMYICMYVCMCAASQPKCGCLAVSHPPERNLKKKADFVYIMLSDVVRDLSPAEIRP